MAGHDTGDADAHVAGQRQDLFGLIAGVHDTCLAAAAGAHDPAVFLKQTDNDAADF
jgi:hypothetical protein